MNSKDIFSSQVSFNKYMSFLVNFVHNQTEQSQITGNACALHWNLSKGAPAYFSNRKTQERTIRPQRINQSIELKNAIK